MPYKEVESLVVIVCQISRSALEESKTFTKDSNQSFWFVFNKTMKFPSLPSTLYFFLIQHNMQRYTTAMHHQRNQNCDEKQNYDFFRFSYLKQFLSGFGPTQARLIPRSYQLPEQYRTLTLSDFRCFILFRQVQRSCSTSPLEFLTHRRW